MFPLIPINRTDTSRVVTEQGSDHSLTSVSRKVVLMTGSQIETTLCYLDGIIRHHLPNVETTRLVLGTIAGVNPACYGPEIENQVIEFFRDKRPDVVFVSLIEFGLPRLLKLLGRLRKEFNFLCVAGGPYAIEYPDECASENVFDVVNYSHGLDSWKIIAAPNNLATVPNILFRADSQNATWTRNAPSSIAFSMDTTPLPYWSVDNLYLLANPTWWGNARPDDTQTTIRHMLGTGGAYPVEHHQWPARHSGVVILSTGCPVNTCNFCAISRMYDREKLLFKEEFPDARRSLRKVSWWSPQKSVEILESYLSHRSNTRYIVFNDNDFASIPRANVDTFLQLYKKRINLPFYCQCSPHLTVAQGQGFVDKLVDAGLHTYCMGVESNAASNNQVYNRHGANKLVFDAIAILAPHAKSGQIHLALDFINGNDAESREDLLSTINLVRDIPLPWDLAIHNLTLSDNTPLSQHIKNADLQKNKRPLDYLLHDIHLSDYHHANLSVFLALKEPWLNLVLQWLGGRHDHDMAGCLQRDFAKFSNQEGILRTRAKFGEFDRLIRKHSSLPSCIEFLTNNEVIDTLQNHPEVMVFLYQTVPGITYGYHESDRYAFDWNVARQFSCATRQHG